MEGNLAGRLKLYIDSLGISVSQFADACGIPRPSLSQLLTGRNKKVSNMLVEQIHRAFPDLSVLWLMFGEGPVRNSLMANDGDAELAKLSEDLENVSGTSGESKYLKEIGLKMASDVHKGGDNKVFECDLKIAELQQQIAEMRRNPRKVTQITIYYEDSTFETFVPGNK